MERGLLAQEERFTEADREKALELASAVRALIDTNSGEPMPDEAVEVIDRAAQEAGLHPHFYQGGRPSLDPVSQGAQGALGRLVATAFLARFDGSFAHLKQCANDGCRAVFYDRSKNHTGRWCSMQVCGNRAKVRAWRERQRAGGGA